MGTISDKLTYLNTTKSQLKDMINYGLDDNNKITSSTTFRNYVSSIFNAFLEALRTPDTLFTNLPKKSGSGSNITLNDTANAPMRIELGASELSQSGTPTPSSPQAIHTISGSNTIKVEGKNLTNIPDGSATMNNQYYKDVATNIIITSDMVGKKISFSYDINITSITTTSTAVSGVIGRGPASAGMTNQIKTSTYSPTTGRHSIKIENVEILEAWVGQYLIIRFIGFGAPSTCSYEYSNVQIEKGSTATSYEPYIEPQEAEVDLSSKNLFDINDFESKISTSFTTSIRNSEINIKRSSATQYLYPLNCKANTQYTIKLKVKNTNSDFYVLLMYSDNTNTRIVGETALNDYTEITITSTANKTITSLRVDEYGWSNDLYLKDIMLNEGTTALPYEEYYSYGEYSKIGNYEDVIFKNIPAFTDYDSNLIEGAWYIKKNIGKVVLDGSEEGYGSDGNTGSYYRYTFTLDNPKVQALGLCNYFEYKFNYNLQTPHFYITETSNKKILFFSEETSIANFKIWLGTHNVIVQYQLATPTYTQITGTLANQLENVYQKLLSYTGQTNISQVNNDLSFNLSVSAIEEL